MRTAAFLLGLLGLNWTATAQVADAGPDTSLCVNSYTMQASAVPPRATGQWTLYMGCATFMDPTSPTTPVTDLCVGTNVMTWTIDDNGTFTSDWIEINVYDPNMPPANAGPDTITVSLPQNSAQLSATPAIYPATCQWTIMAGTATIANPISPTTMVSGLMVGDNIFIWTCENGPCWPAPTSDTLVIQMMQLPTGIGAGNDDASFFTWDPHSQWLALTGNARLESMIVLDAQGRVVRMAPAGGTARAWSMAGQAPGMYLVRAVMDGRVCVMRLVLVR